MSLDPFTQCVLLHWCKVDPTCRCFPIHVCEQIVIWVQSSSTGSQANQAKLMKGCFRKCSWRVLTNAGLIYDRHVHKSDTGFTSLQSKRSIQQGYPTDVQATKVHDSRDELTNPLDDMFWGLFLKKWNKETYQGCGRAQRQWHHLFGEANEEEKVKTSGNAKQPYLEQRRSGGSRFLRNTARVFLAMWYLHVAQWIHGSIFQVSHHLDLRV